jgi:3-carboxy-cis,cis-muconate cycloisomerase
MAAHSLVGEASRRAVAEGRSLRDILAEDKSVTDALGNEALGRLFDPLNYTGAANSFIDRVLKARAPAKP